MYANFFGFNVKPFELTPDSNFLYLSHELKEVFATLKYGIIQRRGFMLLIGEPGTGKTTLINSLIDISGVNANFAYIFNPDLDFNELLHTILIEFDLASVNEDLKKTKAMHKLKVFVGEQFEIGGNVVIIVDEAQTLNSKTLEQLRLLSNLETRKHKLIQIILSGQPELENTLSQKSLTQLTQRIGLRCRTKPLNEKDAYEYMDHRLKVAGYNGPQLFGNKAKYLIWTYSEGIPRIINTICDHSLLSGYSADQKRIDSAIVNEVIDDLNKVPLDKSEYPLGESVETIEEIPQTPLSKSNEIRETPPGSLGKEDGDSSDIIGKLREKLSGGQESESVAKKQRRFKATSIAVIAGIVIIINISILFLFMGSFKAFRNEVSSDLKAMKNNFKSQLGGIENSINKAATDNKSAIPNSLPVSRPDVEDKRENKSVIVKKGETLHNIILRVYGKDDPKILDAILKINPEIKNPDFITVNQVIKLPDEADLD